MPQCIQGTNVPASRLLLALKRRGLIRANDILNLMTKQKPQSDRFVQLTEGTKTAECKQLTTQQCSSQLLLNAIVEAIPQAIALKDARKLQFVSLNKAGEELMGDSRDKIIGKNDYDFFPKAQADLCASTDKQAIEERKIVEIPEQTLQTKHRGQRILHTKKIPISDARGNPQYVLVISEDITERQQVEADQQSRKQIVTILESVADAFLTLDRDWRFTFLNSQAEAIFSSQESLIGRCIWEKFPNLVGSAFDRQFRHAAADGVTVEFERFCPGFDAWLEVRASPHPEGLSVYFRDVSEKKRAEAELLERSQLSTLAAEIGAILGQGGSLPVILDRCTETLVAHLNCAGARIWTFDADSQILELQAISGQIASADPLKARISLGISIIGFIAAQKQPYLTNDAVNDICIGDPDWASSERLVAFAGYPLVVEDRLVGVLAVLGNHPFTSGCTNALSWVANAIGMAIDRAWARSELMSRRESLLFRLASHIRKSLDLNTILDTAVREIRNLLKVDRCHFLWCWPDPESPSLTVTHEARNPELPSMLGDCQIEHARTLVEKIQHRQTIRIDDLTRIHKSGVSFANQKVSLSDGSILDWQFSSQGITSQLLLPLETRAGQLGAIVCSHCSGPRPWSDSEVELLQAACDQLAIAIDQAELYTQTRADAFRAQAQAQQLEEAYRQLQQTQAQLVQTEKMSGLGQMVAGVAHEINNPVNFIVGNLTHASDYIKDLLSLLDLYRQHYPNPVPEIGAKTEAIELEFLRDDLPKLFDSMQAGANRIGQIVLSLRNFSRLDEAEKKLVNVHEGIDNTLMILQHRFKLQGAFQSIEIVKEYGNLPLVECYAGQLNQVFMNIIANAIDSLDVEIKRREEMETGKTEELPIPTIWIRTEAGDRDWIAIRIADNGPGMTEQVKKRLFDPFFTTKPVGKGTGLGLSISYQIVVEKHGGVLECISELGKGAEFSIRIPIS